MKEFESYFSCSNLLCQETEEEVSFFETEAEDDENLYLNDKDDDDEYIEKLIQRETSCISDYPITIRNKWPQCARLNAIEWMFNDGKLWVIRLLSVACLSLAAKMEERRVPVLSEYPTQDHFENKKSIWWIIDHRLLLQLRC
ncbi:cyclin-D5-1-like [Gossypium australe]|uniref:Cyclin-D5-1-like n=1 Tax=Gossypium australe TaxID=47621 RepID=A0A5B6UXK9_9ROSI|nr:cyclin-D5-1-like [Gossypium australe]